MPKRTHGLVIPTYGFITEDPTLHGGVVSKARIRAACDLIKVGMIPRDVIVPFPQRDAANKGTGHMGSLGANIAAYVANLPEFRDAEVRTLSKTWGTWEDTIESLCMIGANAPNQPIHVHFVSEWAQLGRLWVIWHTVKPRGWTADFHLAPNLRTKKDIWGHEPRSYAKLLFLHIPRYLFARFFRRA